MTFAFVREHRFLGIYRSCLSPAYDILILLQHILLLKNILDTLIILYMETYGHDNDE